MSEREYSLSSSNQPTSHEILALSETVAFLIGPTGSPWERRQTLESLKKSLSEEAAECIESIDHGDNEEIADELGDLLMNCVFIAQVAQKEGRFPWYEPFLRANQKMIRRLPHMFLPTGPKQLTEEEALQQWEEIKAQEKERKPARRLSQEIPPSLPTLSRLQKLIKKIASDEINNTQESSQHLIDHGDHIQKALYTLVTEANKIGIDLEERARALFYSLKREIDS